MNVEKEKAKGQHWPEAFREYLASTYQYDPETGYVTRKYEPARGPKQAGYIGSLTSTNDLLVVIRFENKQYSIRVHRLCVFLHTGLVYPKVTHKDFNKLNNKWDNLIPVGKPIGVDGLELNTNEEEIEESARLFRAGKAQREEEAQKKREEARLAREEAAKSHRSGHTSIKKEPEPFVDYQENMRLAFRNPAKEAFQAEPFVREYTELLRQIEQAHEAERFKRGIYTGIQPMEARLFLRDCQRYDGLSKEEFVEQNRHLDKEVGKPGSEMEKWILDRYWLSKNYILWEKYGVEEDKIKRALEIYPGGTSELEYDQVSEALQLRFFAGRAMLEEKHGVTLEALEEKHGVKHDSLEMASS